MAVYAIGDVQGCYAALRCLLEKIQFSSDKDQLWFAGDLVNRGPESLETLRFVKDLGDNAITVLGNHDVSLLAMHYGLISTSKTCKPVIQAPDREVLINWLRFRPVFHYDESLGFGLAHAGISPQWNLSTAVLAARELETSLRGSAVSIWLKHIYGNKPKKWSDTLCGYDRHRYIVNAYMRMRFVHHNTGALNFTQKKPPGKSDKALKQLVPWFEYKNREVLPLRIVFGHWSALGFYQDEQVIGLDTGCVWKGHLTAVKLDDADTPRFKVKCKKR